MDLPQIPGYRLLEKVGEGEFRDVYRAWKILEFGDGSQKDDRTDIYPCALKIYKSVKHIDTGIGELRIRRDTLKGGKGSEHIEQVYHFGQLEDGRLFTETEFIDGYPILEKEFTNDEGKRKCTNSAFTRTFSFPESVHVGLKVAEALEYLHSRGYVARDLSLTNIMVNDDLSVVKLCDIDHIKRIGDRVEPESRPDGVTKIVGQDYIDFHILENNGFVFDESTDIYALGCCMLYMLGVKKQRLESRNVSEFRKKQRSLVEGIDFGDAPEHLKDGMKKVLAATLGLDGEETRLRNINDFLNRVDPINRDFGLIYRYSGMPVIVNIGLRNFIYAYLREMRSSGREKTYIFEKAVMLKGSLMPHIMFESLGHHDLKINDIKEHNGRVLTKNKGEGIGDVGYFLEGHVLKRGIIPQILGNIKEYWILDEWRDVVGEYQDDHPFHISEIHFSEGPISFRFDDKAEMLQLDAEKGSKRYRELRMDAIRSGCNGDFMEFMRLTTDIDDSFVTEPLIKELRSKGRWVRINELLEGSSEESG